VIFIARHTNYKGPTAGAFGGKRPEPPRARTRGAAGITRKNDPHKMNEHTLLDKISTLRVRAQNRRQDLLETMRVTEVNADSRIVSWTDQANELSRIRKERFG